MHDSDKKIESGLLATVVIQDLEDKLHRRVLDSVLAVLPRYMIHMMTQAGGAARLKDRFVDDYPDLIEHRDLFAATIASIEIVDHDLSHDQIVEKAAAAVRAALRLKEDLYAEKRRLPQDNGIDSGGDVPLGGQSPDGAVQDGAGDEHTSPPVPGEIRSKITIP